MSYRDYLDSQSERFLYTWTRPKRQKSQVKGQTKLSHSGIILRSNAKAHRWG
ncbi:YpzG family protein [Neobacillus fumarioli]|uniref:YpzG family protein n=1 Tax=Neobacillus fumarioli TaxID=105229 RepID=UPI0009FE5894|nr:YpzG family protein [Neobacillus fumarioli]